MVLPVLVSSFDEVGGALGYNVDCSLRSSGWDVCLQETIVSMFQGNHRV